jgi:hypothetical protein
MIDCFAESLTPLFPVGGTKQPRELFCHLALYQERAVFGKMKMDPAKRAQTQNAGEVLSL